MGRYLDIVRKLEAAQDKESPWGRHVLTPSWAIQFAKAIQSGPKTTKDLSVITGASEASCRTVLSRHKESFCNVGIRGLGVWIMKEDDMQQGTAGTIERPRWKPTLNGTQAVERGKELEPARVLAEEYWTKGGDRQDSVLAGDLGVADSTLRKWHVTWRVKRGPRKNGNEWTCVCGHTGSPNEHAGHTRGCKRWQTYASSLKAEARERAARHNGEFTKWCDTVGISASWFSNNGIRVYPTRPYKKLPAIFAQSPVAPKYDPPVAHAAPVIAPPERPAIIIEGETHPLIKALLRSMPPQGGVWPKAERAKWLNILDAILGTVYSE